MGLDLTVNLGNLLTAASFVLTVVWGVAKMSNRSDEFFRTLQRHERTLDNHEERLIDHGERIAAIVPLDRRR